jgi:hypothetical protein
MSHAGPEGGGGRRGAAIAWLGWWLVSAAVYLVLVDTVVLPELVTGAVIAVIGATAATLVRAQRRVVIRPRARWLVALWRPVASYPRDLWTVTRALAQREPVRGKLYALPFEPGVDDARSAARRVLGPSAGSFAPNTFDLSHQDRFELDPAWTHARAIMASAFNITAGADVIGVQADLSPHAPPVFAAHSCLGRDAREATSAPASALSRQESTQITIGKDRRGGSASKPRRLAPARDEHRQSATASRRLLLRRDRSAPLAAASESRWNVAAIGPGAAAGRGRQSDCAVLDRCALALTGRQPAVRGGRCRSARRAALEPRRAQPVKSSETRGVRI